MTNLEKTTEQTKYEICLYEYNYAPFIKNLDNKEYEYLVIKDYGKINSDTNFITPEGKYYTFLSWLEETKQKKVTVSFLREKIIDDEYLLEEKKETDWETFLEKQITAYEVNENNVYIFIKTYIKK